MLPFVGYLGEDLIHVGEVEVATDSEVARSPVVAAQERVDIGQPALACSGVAEVSHVEVACKRQTLLGEDSVVEFFAGEVAKLAVDGFEDFCDGSRAESSLAKHVFLA